VVLMLENRSFDHMLGFLDHPDQSFPRLRAGEHPNRRNPADPGSPATGVSADATYTLAVDPPHSHKSAMEQLNLRIGRRARMDGFVAAYVRKASGNDERPVIHWWRLGVLGLAVVATATSASRRFVGGSRPTWLVVRAALAGALTWRLVQAKRRIDDPPSNEVATEVGADVMRCMAPERVPVLATLAKEFAVCTNWHCSVPGETWPNRNFLHAATSERTVDIELGFYDSPTIFDTLEEHGASWRVYHDGRAHLWAFRNLWRGSRIGRWEPTSTFEEHVAGGDLAAYSFIEPDHQGGDSNSQHPGNNGPEKAGVDFVRAEELIAHVYDVLRRHPQAFEKTLLVITYDEHGGLFDHVPPPHPVPAPPPLKRERLSLAMLSRRFVAFFIERRSPRFGFRLLGPRVPTVIISPLIPVGTIDHQVHDHTSVVSTLRSLFAPGAQPLTARDEWAATFDHLASLGEPRRGADMPEVAAPPRSTAPSPAAVRPMVPGLSAPDEFSHQLDQLGDLVSSELEPRGVAGSGAPAGSASPAGRSEQGDEAVRRFRNAAAEARQSGGHG